MSVARLFDHSVLGLGFLAAARREAAPNLVVASLPPLELAAAAALHGNSRKVPVVLDIRDLWPDVFIDALPKRIRPVNAAILSPYRALARFACERATAIIGPTKEYLGWGLKHASREQGPLDGEFPFGYATQKPSEGDASDAERAWEALGISRAKNEFIVCFFGSLGRQFDIETVINAARILSAKCVSAKIVICGAGEREAEYRVQASDCDNILFAGWVGRHMIWSLMGLASVGLAPYLPTANFLGNVPNKPIEYLSSGLPVLHCLGGALKRTLDEGRCGIEYRFGDPEDLAMRIAECSKDRNRLQKLSANAKQLFLDRFEADRVYGQLARHLVQIAERRCEGGCIEEKYAPSVCRQSR